MTIKEKYSITDSNESTKLAVYLYDKYDKIYSRSKKEHLIIDLISKMPVELFEKELSIWKLQN